MHTQQRAVIPEPIPGEPGLPPPGKQQRNAFTRPEFQFTLLWETTVYNWWQCYYGHTVHDAGIEADFKEVVTTKLCPSYCHESHNSVAHEAPAHA